MLERGKLPPAHSPDRDLLFGLDEEGTASRLHERLPSDSPYADQMMWSHVGLGEGSARQERLADMPESWLRRLAGERLLTPPHTVVGQRVGVATGERAVTAQASELHLVSFMFRSTESPPPLSAPSASAPASGAAAPAGASPAGASSA